MKANNIINVCIINNISNISNIIINDNENISNIIINVCNVLLILLIMWK